MSRKNKHECIQEEKIDAIGSAYAEIHDENKRLKRKVSKQQEQLERTRLWQTEKDYEEYEQYYNHECNHYWAELVWAHIIWTFIIAMFVSQSINTGDMFIMVIPFMLYIIAIGRLIWYLYEWNKPEKKSMDKFYPDLYKFRRGEN